MICYRMAEKVSKEQFNVRLGKKTIERLERLAERYKGDKRGRAEVAAEIIEFFLPHWEEGEKRQLDFRNKQLIAVAKMKGE